MGKTLKYNKGREVWMFPILKEKRKGEMLIHYYIYNILYLIK